MYSSIKYQVWNFGNIVHFNLEFIRLQQAKKSCSNWEKIQLQQTQYIFQKSCVSTIDVSPGVFNFVFQLSNSHLEKSSGFFDNNDTPGGMSIVEWK